MNGIPRQSEKAKLALIPVLGFVLYAVLPAGTDAPDGQIPELVRPQSSDGASHSEDSPRSRREIQWPRYSLQMVAAHNPFALSDPRAELDQRFLTAGITTPAEMTAITQDEFFTDLQGQIPSESPDDVRSQPVAEIAINTNDTAAEKDKVAEALRLSRLRLNELSNQPVTMFMKSESGNSAMVGGRRITEGEFIADGIRVAEITRRGVRYQVVPTQTSPNSIHTTSN